MKCQSLLWIALVLLTRPLLTQSDSPSPPTSSSVNGYTMLDTNRVYRAGEQVRVDEPHGVYTGLILMDNYYFLRLVAVTETERRQESGNGFRGPFAVSG